jgi:phosphoribosylamine--glycine ligase
VLSAGTKSIDGKVVTSGGRVISVSSWGKTMKEALSISYRNAGLLNYEGLYFRTDIGFDL